MKTIYRKSVINEGRSLAPWREQLNEVIFGSETPAGRNFDVLLIVFIILSTLVAIIDSVESLHNQYAELLNILEWVFTLLFSLEYFLRLLCVRHPWLYMRSFYGIVDLLSILPSYISLFMPGVHYAAVVRILRLLRIFRILKLSVYLNEANLLKTALYNSRWKIMVFLYTVLTLVVICGTLMYVIEGKEAGFTSIPRSMYWAIVTLTTVGYGDIAPNSTLGQIAASFIMIMGYGIIAVPTGIYGAELIKTVNQANLSNEACPDCGRIGHDIDASYCKYCGHNLADLPSHH
ncbi:MAG: ion transporter [Methylomonas sp.]|jgi:voltage-gated potassium channel|uniref:ion transporter n=1 Tax=Methylomonas sp. TaxID=418 RepID=UPI0025CDC600|nr:ion transporter [Methylomonas sp.]MCK9604853.1 ion transporter [Methylomonas sp.]